MTLSINGTTVEFSMTIETAEDAMSLINILSCFEYDTDEYRDLYDFIYRAIHAHDIYFDEEWEEPYWELARLEEARYYDSNIDAFNEYCTHKNEPDFDWDFYSDWHKDLFGFRPR